MLTKLTAQRNDDISQASGMQCQDSMIFALKLRGSIGFPCVLSTMIFVQRLPALYMLMYALEVVIPQQVGSPVFYSDGSAGTRIRLFWS